jgi:hypothetical protein
VALSTICQVTPSCFTHQCSVENTESRESSSRLFVQDGGVFGSRTASKLRASEGAERLCPSESNPKSIFHVFLSGAYGREHLLQSAYLAKSLRLPLTVYVPRMPEFVMYCSRTVISVRIDSIYLQSVETAEPHVCSLLRPFGIEFEFFKPTSFTGGALPDVPGAWSVMTCPRLVASMPSWWSSRHTGPNPKQIVRHVRFPVFIPCSVAVAWKSISMFIDDTPAGIAAARIGVEIAHRAHLPLTMYEVIGSQTRPNGDTVAKVLESIPTLRQLDTRFSEPHLVTRADALYGLPRDSLVVTGFSGARAWWTLRQQPGTQVMIDRLPNPVLAVTHNTHPFYFVDRLLQV